jgi:radical SAM superfamily enzyme YgiQ (UPF0313 family)
MRILLILPYDGAPPGLFKLSVSYAPLTLAILAALVPPELEARVEILDEGLRAPGDFRRNSYDIVGISGCTSASARAYELCAYWKARGAHTVLGGPHATLLPEEALRHADTVCVGLGERIWPQFLRDFSLGVPQRLYRHSYTDAPCPMPVPRRDLLPPGAYMSMTTVLAHRGCSNACEFCSLTAQWGHKGLARPIEEVVAEIGHLAAASRKREFIFLDPSMYSHRDYSCRLMEALIPLNIVWHGLSTLNMADDKEYLALAVRSGCAGILAGLESLDARTMTDINKRHNEPQKYREQIARLQAGGIAVFGCFVLGFDGDTIDSMRKNIAEILDLGLDVPRFAVLTPFPGTPLFDRLDRERRILTRDWSRYDTEQVVYRPANMTSEQLQRVLREAWRSSYSFKQIFRRAFAQPHRRLPRLAVNLGFRFNTGRLAQRR